jgi:hypothetical protein
MYQLHWDKGEDEFCAFAKQLATHSTLFEPPMGGVQG